MASDRHQSLRELVSDILRDRIKDRNSKDLFDAEKKAILDAVHAELTAAAGDRNLSAARTIYHLPEELFLRCIEFSDFHARRDILGVCRSWRRIMMASPLLWTRCVARIESLDDLSFLRMHLHLSKDLPISLELSTVDWSYDLDVTRFVLQHMDRIRSLTLKYHVYEPSNIMSSPSAPMLEFMKVDGEIQLFRAPRLRAVLADSLRIEDTDYCFDRLVFVKGDIVGQNSRDFFRLCPNLECLYLTAKSSHSSSEWPRSPFPASLKHLVLCDSYRHARDYLPALNGCTSLRYIELNGAYAAQDPFDVFEGTGNQISRLEFSRDGSHLSSDAGTGLELFFSGKHNYFRISSITRSLPTLRHLVLIPIATDFAFTLQLPMLETLTWNTATELLELHSLVYHAPVLQVFRLHIEKHPAHNSSNVSSLIAVFAEGYRTNFPVSQLDTFVLASDGLDADIGPNYDISDIVDLSPLRKCVRRAFNGERELSLGHGV